MELTTICCPLSKKNFLDWARDGMNSISFINKSHTKFVVGIEKGIHSKKKKIDASTGFKLCTVGFHEDNAKTLLLKYNLCWLVLYKQVE